LNHDETVLCTRLERDFLHDMEAGCSAPVGSFAEIRNGRVHFKAVALSLDGKEKFEATLDDNVDDSDELGHQAARQLLSEGADKVVAEHKKS